MAANQAKPWFEANRAVYERELNAPCKALAELVAAEYAMRDWPLTGDAKRSTFRIHRDVRFSKDKSPYKTQGAVVWRRPGAGKGATGVVYLHIADGGCFVAAGFWEVDRPVADAIRAGIRNDPSGFTAATEAASAAGLTLDTSDSTVRMPRGFEDVTDPALVPAIKTRNLIVSRRLTKAVVGSAKLVRAVLDASEAALPLLRFGWNAIEEAGPPPDWTRLH